MLKGFLGDDAVVLITGGASGIGRATALLAASMGAKVAVGDVNADNLDRVVKEIEAAGGVAMAARFDVTSESETQGSVAAVEQRLGPLTGLVACAGASMPQPAEDMTDEAWNRIIGINLTGVFMSCQAVGAKMISRGRGSIVTIGSTDSLGGHSGRAHYSASKHGVAGLSKTLALEWGRLGVRVNCVAPGAVDTPLLRGGVPADHIDSVLFDRTPMARLGTGEDMARAALFLLSPMASYINGAVLPVDGGLSGSYLARWNGADLASTMLLQSGVYSIPAEG